MVRLPKSWFTSDGDTENRFLDASAEVIQHKPNLTGFSTVDRLSTLACHLVELESFLTTSELADRRRNLDVWDALTGRNQSLSNGTDHGTDYGEFIDALTGRNQFLALLTESLTQNQREIFHAFAFLVVQEVSGRTVASDVTGFSPCQLKQWD